MNYWLLQVYVDGLVKQAYENWIHVIEYDGKTLLDFKQNQNIASSQSDLPIGQQDLLSSYDHHVTLPTLSVPVPQDQPAMHSGPTVEGTLFMLRIIVACIRRILDVVGTWKTGCLYIVEILFQLSVQSVGIFFFHKVFVAYFAALDIALLV